MKKNEQLSARAAFLKTRMINHLEKYLIEFESQFTQRKGLVAFVSDHNDAREVIQSFVLPGTQVVIDSQDEILNEIQIPALLSSMELKVTNYQNMRHDQSQLENDEIPALLAFWVPDMVVSESGAIIIQTGIEQFRRLEQFGYRFIFVSGIEQFISADEDIALFTHLKSSWSGGKLLSDYYVYQTLSSSPDMFLLIDNGRSKILEQTNIRPVLNCIQCDSCNQNCPLQYFDQFRGPQKMIMDAFLLHKNDAKGLFFSTLCGKCTHTCPMNISLHEIILHSRTHFRSADTNVFPPGTVLNLEKQESGGGLLRGLTRKFFANILFKGESADYFQSFDLPEKSYIKQMIEETRKKR